MAAVTTSDGVLAVLVALLAAPAASDAMGIQEERRLLARSADGSSTLYEVRGRGPEGGGSLTYRIEGKVRRKSVEFLLSSDFSPGGSSRPQLVPVPTCEQRLEALSAELAKRGIRGVAVSPARCRTPDRDGLVTIATLPPALPPHQETVATPLTDEEIARVLKSVQPAIDLCYQQYRVPGVAIVNVVISPAGIVGSATTSAKFAGTKTGECVENAVKQARFRKSEAGRTTPFAYQLPSAAPTPPGPSDRLEQM